jgi:acyl carrier protein
MVEKINNMLRQLSEAEQKELFEHIKRQYTLDFKEGCMLRDDIRDRIFELIRSLFTLEVKESMTFRELDLDVVSITALTDAIIKEFDLEEIEFADMMEWQKIQDIVSYVDTSLEN